MAGGSQIIISSDGITIITPRVFKVHAGQHIFKGGQKVSFSLPEFPKPGWNYLKFNISNKDGSLLPSGTTYSLLHPDGSIESGVLPDDGVVATPPSEEPEEYILIVDDENLNNNLIGDE